MWPRRCSTGVCCIARRAPEATKKIATTALWTCAEAVFVHKFSVTPQIARRLAQRLAADALQRGADDGHVVVERAMAGGDAHIGRGREHLVVTHDLQPRCEPRLGRGAAPEGQGLARGGGAVPAVLVVVADRK